MFRELGGALESKLQLSWALNIKCSQNRWRRNGISKENSLSKGMYLLMGGCGMFLTLATIQRVARRQCAWVGPVRDVAGKENQDKIQS